MNRAACGVSWLHQNSGDDEKIMDDSNRPQPRLRRQEIGTRCPIWPWSPMGLVVQLFDAWEVHLHCAGLRDHIYVKAPVGLGLDATSFLCLLQGHWIGQGSSCRDPFDLTVSFLTLGGGKQSEASIVVEICLETQRSLLGVLALPSTRQLPEWAQRSRQAVTHTNVRVNTRRSSPN